MDCPQYYVVFLHPSGLIVAHPADSDDEAEEICRKAGPWFTRRRVPGEQVGTALRAWWADRELAVVQPLLELADPRP